MKKRVTNGLLLAMAVSAALCGCGQKEKDLDSTSVLIRKDGTLKSAVYEPFDINVYGTEELNAFVKDAVSSYNLATVGEAVSSDKDTKTPLSVILNSLECKDGNAILKMEYASCEDYLKFNEAEGNFTELATGTIGDAKDAGINLSVYTVTDGSEEKAVSDLEIDQNIVLVKGNGKVLVGGKIIYHSAGLAVSGDDTAAIDSADQTQVIIFK